MKNITLFTVFSHRFFGTLTIATLKSVDDSSSDDYDEKGNQKDDKNQSQTVQENPKQIKKIFLALYHR